MRIVEEDEDGVQSRALFTVIEIAWGFKELEVEMRRRATTEKDAAERLMNDTTANQAENRRCFVFLLKRF